MGIINFFKNAGEKLFRKEAQAAPETNLESIRNYIRRQGLPTEGLEITFDSVQDRVRISGTVKDQETKEKILLCCGNIEGVAHVEDNLKVAGGPALESQYYTVQSGDTLSKVSKRFYGDPMKYNFIFEANRPMLSHPDKIYPGQSLRIPPLPAGKDTLAQHNAHP